MYRPDEGDEQTWDLADVKVTFAEAKAFEKAAGVKWAELQGEITEGNVGVLQAVLWMLRKRTEPQLTLRDLDDLPMDAAGWRYGAAERKFMRTVIEGDEDLDDEAKKAALALLDSTDEEGEPADEAEPGPKEQPAKPRAKKSG